MNGFSTGSGEEDSRDSNKSFEEIAFKINHGELEDVMGLSLSEIVIEQAQLVAELLASGELKLNESNEISKEITTKLVSQGIKMKKDPSSSESHHDEVEGHKHKKIKLSSSLDDEASNSFTLDSNTESIKAKEATVPPSLTADVASKIKAAGPLHYFLSTIESVPATKSEPLSLTFADLLDPSLGILKESIQINFMVELGWLLAQYCAHKVQRKPLTILYGMESEEMTEGSKLVPTLQTFRVKPKYPFGSHHTKMAIMLYESGHMRIVVHTGNLIESDWEDRTQGLWVSPSCPQLTADETDEGCGESPTFFKRDLLRYFEAYSLSCLKPWIERIRQCDMTSINVCFIPSVPGSHTLQSSSNVVPKWGHEHLASLLHQHASVDKENSTIIMQCSSIGSLGPTPISWLVSELAHSMDSTIVPKEGARLDLPSVKVVYPCFKDVASSINGVLGGGCLPYSKQGHAKQMWFSSFLHKWRSDARLRTKAMPHIKSYARVSADFKTASWFALTSANVSKAAWGMRTNKGATLMIQSFEAGVLFLPKFIYGEGYFDLGTQLSLPYDLPLTKYEKNDEPWFIDNLR